MLLNHKNCKKQVNVGDVAPDFELFMVEEHRLITKCP
jgi:hypothetical protein